MDVSGIFSICVSKSWRALRPPAESNLLRLAGALLALLTFAAAATIADGTPNLRYQASPALTPLVTRLEAIETDRLLAVARLVGLQEAGPPLQVVLVEETEELALAVPPWISGFARSEDSLVVIFPARVPSYPDSTLEGVLLHEVAHVLIGRAAGHHQVPRWMNEGLAMIAGSPWDLGDRSRLTLALFRGQPPSLAALDRRFTASARDARSAYALAGAFTQDLLRRHGSDSTAKILRGLAAGLTFRASFRRATGRSLGEVEDSFWDRYTFWYRWVPILTSSATLWIGITVLSLLAIRRRRQRDRQIRQDWDEQEARMNETEDKSIN